MLEASSFDFRNRHPQQLLVKLAKYYGLDKGSSLVRTAYGISLDLYRTFAPLKQSTPTLAFACLELAGRLLNERIADVDEGRNYEGWGINRGMVMGASHTDHDLSNSRTLPISQVFIFGTGD